MKDKYLTMNNPEVKGLHHFTAIAGDPTENAKFYVNKLGMRLVKKSVNHDAPEMYHLFYGDKEGTPGSSITFFPGMTENNGVMGEGMISELGLKIPKNAFEYWKKRLNKLDINAVEEEWRNKSTLSFEDNSGLPVRLVPGTSEDFVAWEKSEVPVEKQITGMNHVTFALKNKKDINTVLQKIGLEKKGDFYDASDGTSIKVEETEKKGRMGIGSVHHVAFKAGESSEDIEAMRENLIDIGLNPSPTISRKYFTSTYARTKPGILLEFSSMGPGYSADETIENLGTSLKLPERLEKHREKIEQSLPDFREEEIIQ